MFRNLSDGAKGAYCMIIGSLLLTSQDAITKWLTSSYHAGEILFYRGIFTFLPIIFLVLWAGDIKLLRTRSFKSTLLRAVLGSATSVFVVLSFAFLPLATALAIIFLSPILLTALSVPFLGETVGWRRWCAVFVGFCGVLLIIQPGQGGVWIYFLIPLFTALLVTMRDIVTRRMRGGDTSLSILFYSMLVAVLTGGISLPIFGYSFPNWSDIGLFAAAGIMVSFSHLLIIQALLFAPGATVAPFKYLSLVYAAGIGYVVWGDIPNLGKIVGAVLVVLAGLFILYREMNIKKTIP